MPVGTVTIDWDIRDPATGLPATGHVRLRHPTTLRDTTGHVLYGPSAGPWLPLTAGKGSTTVLDPHDPAVSPSGWSPIVEVRTNVLNTAYPIVIPPGSASTTIHLDTKAPVVEVPAVNDYALVSTVTTLEVRVDALEDAPPGGGVTDHGALTGLADDDHTQYFNAGRLATALTPYATTSAVASALAGKETAGAAAAVASTLAPVATAGTYTSLTGKPTIPTVPGDIGAQPAGDYATNTALTSGLATKAATSHTHAIADTTGLQSTLDGKVGLALVDAAGDLLVGSANDAVTRLAKGANGTVLTVAGGAVGWTAPAGGGTSIKRTNTGLVLTSFTASSGSGGAWTVCPAAYRVTIPAAAGDVLRWEPAVIANPGDSGYELDLAAINGAAAPVRYASSRTSTQATNGHGGMYMGGAYSRTMRGLTWLVEAGDIVSGNVTLALLYRAGSGMTIGSGAYPSEIDVVNLGTPA